MIVIGAALLKYHAWYYLGVYAAIALLWAWLLRVSIRHLGGLLGTELIFLSLLALPLGWERASFLLLRSLVCLVAMNSFLLTLPPHSFGIALKGLPVPAPLKENLLLAGQYIGNFALRSNPDAAQRSITWSEWNCGMVALRQCCHDWSLVPPQSG